jgi:hypothetical protein
MKTKSATRVRDQINRQIATEAWAPDPEGIINLFLN